MEHACSQAVQWQRQGNSIRVSVNLSTRDLVNQDLPAIVAEIAERRAPSTEPHGVSADQPALMSIG